MSEETTNKISASLYNKPKFGMAKLSNLVHHKKVNRRGTYLWDCCNLRWESWRFEEIPEQVEKFFSFDL